MAQYKYKATNAKGRTVSGKMEALSETDLYVRLREKNLYMVSSEETGDKGGSKKLKPKVVCEFCRSLGTLLGAGVSLVRALSIVSQEETTKPAHRKIYERVLRNVRQGMPLSDSMEAQGNAFPELLIHMIRSAEASGNLDKVTLRMADHFEKDYRLKSKVTSAMMYPLILLILIIAVVLILFTFVIPQFADMFAQMEELPLPTRIVMGASDGLKAHWVELLIGCFVGWMALVLIFRIPPVRLAWDKLKVHAPVFGKLLKIIYTARFARTLSSLYSSGLPIVTALQVGRKTVGNEYINSQFDKIIARLRAGENLSTVLGDVDGFTKKLSSSILIGEETGSLDTMLTATANSMEYESEAAIQKMTTFIEPIMIVIMAIVVGLVVMSVIMPLYGSYDAIGGEA